MNFVLQLLEDMYLKEKMFLFPGSSERPADIFIPNYSGGKNLFLDVAVTCPVQHKYVVDAAQMLGFFAMTMLMKSKQKTLKQEFMKKVPYTFQQFLNLLEDFQETFQFFFLLN